MGSKTQNFEEKLKKFKEFVDTVKGHKDVKTRVEVLANPENLDTMSILTKSQAKFLANANWLASRPEWGGMFLGLKQYAQSLREPSISINGEGREQTIRFMGAISESKFLSKLGINVKGEDKK